ncbi:MAG: GHMP kinase [Saprospiraceae bacterium]|jgi:hypothetical protein|nr:GHMP kinase [Saprospiraceae bacterium]MBK7795817.1 GHMP kinase [Saprospiraceae bacterium]MBK8154371.1 GHMP kinase [Saprospiraceae bacterium]MBK9379385.1 GHMP kinase [Saprospiraceae bacterium]MBL0260928.1 GHMP kinase [Saprospiraceae bacterium]
MKVQELSGSEVLWNSYDENGKKWFSAEIDLMGFDVVETTDPDIGKYLRKLFKACCQNNSEFLSHWKKYKVDHYLEFPRNWGLGSSSTLIYNMAAWADVNPYHLYFDIEEGSGYDIACAGADSPVLFTLGDGSIDLSEIDYLPPFMDQLFFIPLNQKADSRDAVKFTQKNKPDSKLINKVSQLTDRLIGLKTLSSFEEWVEEHENLIGNYLGVKPIRQTQFPDFPGAVKSLGAWGGDMVLACGKRDTVESYFHNKGFTKIIPYKELVL